MVNFDKMREELPRMQHLSTSKFAFPIQGPQLATGNQYALGNILLLPKEDFEIRYQFNGFRPAGFTTPTVGIIDYDTISNTPPNKHETRHTHCLNFLKSFLGALHIAIFKANRSCEKKAIISNSATPEINEGFSLCYGLDEQNYNSIKGNFDPNFNISSVSNQLEAEQWTSLFSTPIDKQTELQRKIFKLLEISYYSSNDIHAYTRMINWFIALNYAFRESEDQKINRPHITKNLNIIFSNILKYTPFDCKFNKGFDALYDRVRNNILHGILPHYELTLVEKNDYEKLKNIFYKLIVFLVENDEINKMKTTSDVITYLKNYRP